MLLLLAVLLVLTLSVQYYVSQRSVRSNTQFIARQQRAVMAGVALGVNSLSSGLYLDQMRDQVNPALLGQQAERVKNVLIVDEEGNIKDSLDRDQVPQFNPDKSIRYVKVKDISLPPLRGAVELRSDNVRLPEGMTIGNFTAVNDPGAFYFPVTTTDGTRFVIVVLASASSTMTLLNRQARQSLLITLAVLLVTTCLTGLVVWRFKTVIMLLADASTTITYRVPSVVVTGK